MIPKWCFFLFGMHFSWNNDMIFFFQLSPLDSPTVVDKILGYWKPIAVFLMESELWPNLVISAANKGVSNLQELFFNVLKGGYRW